MFHVLVRFLFSISMLSSQLSVAGGFTDFAAASAKGKNKSSIDQCNAYCYVFHTYYSGGYRDAFNELLDKGLSQKCGKLGHSEVSTAMMGQILSKLDQCDKHFGPDGTESQGLRCTASDSPRRTNYSIKLEDQRVRELLTASDTLYSRQNWSAQYGPLDQKTLDKVLKTLNELPRETSTGERNTPALANPFGVHTLIGN